MLDLYELRQLTAFAELETLSRVAETFHISTPSVTRAMQHLEEEFGAELFVRGKNKIRLNETGRVAAACAEKLLQEADRAVQQVRDFDQRQRTVVVRSCAPAPLWELLPKLNARRLYAKMRRSLPPGREEPATSPFCPVRWRGPGRSCGKTSLSACRRSMSWPGTTR